MKRIIALTLTAVTSLSALAQVDKERAEANPYNPLNPAMMSLGIAPDARGGGMGDVGAATDPDEVSQFWNPAKQPGGLGFIDLLQPWRSDCIQQ